MADGPAHGHDVDTAVVAVGLHRGGPLDERDLGGGEKRAERGSEAARGWEVGAGEAVVVDEARAGGLFIPPKQFCSCYRNNACSCRNN